jgi:hypothetical protein
MAAATKIGRESARKADSATVYLTRRISFDGR